MTVYVDPPMPIGGHFNNYCHLFADSVEELHQFADKLGLKPSWFQPAWDHPHYDISPSKREMAIKLGALEVDRAFAVRWMQVNRLKNEIKRNSDPFNF